MAVHVGEIPVVSAVPEAISDPGIRAWTISSGSPPNFWAALGHDAAILARRAVAGLPLDVASDAAEVSKRRAAVKAALLVATAHLWTSETQGFASAHALQRIIGVEELPNEPTATSRKPR
jgi:hypothetical protein